MIVIWYNFLHKKQSKPPRPVSSDVAQKRLMVGLGLGFLFVFIILPIAKFYGFLPGRLQAVSLIS